jgi:hypothetical protein
VLADQLSQRAGIAAGDGQRDSAITIAEAAKTYQLLADIHYTAASAVAEGTANGAANARNYVEAQATKITHDQLRNAEAAAAFYKLPVPAFNLSVAH